MSNRGRRWKQGEPKKKCMVEECKKVAHGFGYCRKHYVRFKNFGDPYLTMRKSHRDERGCWVYVRVRLP